MQLVMTCAWYARHGDRTEIPGVRLEIQGPSQHAGLCFTEWMTSTWKDRPFESVFIFDTVLFFLIFFYRKDCNLTELRLTKGPWI